MKINWHDYAAHSANTPIQYATLQEIASIIGRVGLMTLACGTGAWRVRSSMNILSQALGLTLMADIGLLSINCTFFDGKEALSQTLCLKSSGINATKRSLLEGFVKIFDRHLNASCEEIQRALDDIEEQKAITVTPS